MKVGERECFRVESGVKQGYIMSPRLFNMYERYKNVDGEDGSEVYGGREMVEIACFLLCR